MKPGMKRPATSLQKESKKEKIDKQRVYEETRRNRPYLTRWEAEFLWLVYEGPGKDKLNKATHDRAKTNRNSESESGSDTVTGSESENTIPDSQSLSEHAEDSD